jgi:hypothetical protein
MAPTSLGLVLMTADGRDARIIATLRWPAHLATEARAFIRDNLIAERVGDSRRAEAMLVRGRVTAAERAAFLAERPSFLPEPPAALAREVELEDLVAEFSVGLSELRRAEGSLDLVFSWRE